MISPEFTQAHDPLKSQLLDGEEQLKFVVLADYEKLAMCADAWRELLARSAADEPMLSPTWLLTWWRTYASKQQLRVGMYFYEGRLVGLSPLLACSWWHRPGIPFRRLQPLGADAETRDGVCSEYLNFICEIGYEDRVAQAFVSALVNNSFGAWDELVLPMMDGAGPMPELLRNLLHDAGLETNIREITRSSYAPLTGSWENYLEQLGSKRRYYVKRALRDFAAWAGNEFEIREAKTLAELADGKSVLTSLHAERWQAAGRRGAFSAQRFEAFHDAVMPQLLDEGRLQLLWLKVRGEPVAVQYNIVANGKVYFYQSGRKMNVPEGQRPGIVLFAHALQKAIAGGLWEFDFLGGECQYKSKLAIASRPLVELRAARRTLKEKLRLAAQSGMRWAKRAMFGEKNGSNACQDPTGDK